MIRTYKHDGKLWRYEEGDQPANAVLVEAAASKGETPEKRAAEAPKKRKKAAE